MGKSLWSVPSKVRTEARTEDEAVALSFLPISLHNLLPKQIQGTVTVNKIHFFS